MNRQILRSLYLVVKYVPLFDEGIPPLYRIKAWAFGSYFHANGPLYVGRYANIGQAHENLQSFIRIGREVEFREMVVVDYSGGVEIGDYVTVSAGAKIYTHNHGTSSRDIRWRDQPIEFTPLSIGSDSWIGSGAIILPGVRRIGQGAVIGAGAVVTREVCDFVVVAGNPARPIGMRGPSAVEARPSDQLTYQG